MEYNCFTNKIYHQFQLEIRIEQRSLHYFKCFIEGWSERSKNEGESWTVFSEEKKIFPVNKNLID